MLMPNRVVTTKCPANFCTWTFAACVPPKCETAPRSRLRWPEEPPVKTAPSGALTKLTAMAPCVCDFMETAAVEVLLPEPLRCAHPSVTREEPNNSNGRTKRGLISTPPAELWSQGVSLDCSTATPLLNSLIGRSCVINRVADCGSTGCGERNRNCHREIAVRGIRTRGGQRGLGCVGDGDAAYAPGVDGISSTQLSLQSVICAGGVGFCNQNINRRADGKGGGRGRADDAGCNSAECRDVAERQRGSIGACAGSQSNAGSVRVENQLDGAGHGGGHSECAVCCLGEGCG